MTHDKPAGLVMSLVFLEVMVMMVGMVTTTYLGSSLPELRRFQHPSKDGKTLSLLVVGDWGRNGSYNQSIVADQMGRTAEALNIDFVISTGDNFYDDGLRGIGDRAFNDSLGNIYTAHSLQKKWYSVLGNHDYRGDVLAQLSPVLRKIDPRWLCMRSFILDTGIAEFFFVDTTPMVLSYWNDPGKHHYDWRDVAPRDTYISNQLKDLEAALRNSTAKWKLVVGHHTLRSISKHGDTEELVQLLLPVMEANQVDFYINGHDHCLEHISSNNSQLQFLTSGAGSKAWRGVKRQSSHKLRFFHDGQGFMSLQLTQKQVNISFFDLHGNVLHSWIYIGRSQNLN